MRENPYRRDHEEIKALIKQYIDLKEGHSHSFIEEDAFERIIDYFDDKDDVASALEAANYGIEQFPYSPMLQIKKGNSIYILPYKQRILIPEYSSSGYKLIICSK